MSKAKSAEKGSVPKSSEREPTGREKRTIAAAEQSRAKRPARAQFTEEPDDAGVMRLGPQHSDLDGHTCLVAETFGTVSDDFVNANILQLANITMRNKRPSIEGLNASLALVGAIAPANELEAALATQLAATHELSLEMLARAKRADTQDALRDYTNLATKLSRTMAAQIKTLSDWRRGGEQVVRHVHVYEGGQAVVAETVNVGGQQNEKLAFKPHEQGALCAPVPCSDPEGDPLPVPGDKGQEPMQIARRQDKGRRRTSRQPK